LQGGVKAQTDGVDRTTELFRNAKWRPARLIAALLAGILIMLGVIADRLP